MSELCKHLQKSGLQYNPSLWRFLLADRSCRGAWRLAASGASAAGGILQPKGRSAETCSCCSGLCHRLPCRGLANQHPTYLPIDLQQGSHFILTQHKLIEATSGSCPPLTARHAYCPARYLASPPSARNQKWLISFPCFHIFSQYQPLLRHLRFCCKTCSKIIE